MRRSAVTSHHYRFVSLCVRACVCPGAERFLVELDLSHNVYTLFLLPLKAADANSANCNVKLCRLLWKLNVIEIFLDIYHIFQQWLELTQIDIQVGRD